MQRIGSIPILCINVNITIDTMLDFDANVNTDAKCERTFKGVHCSLTLIYIHMQFNDPIMKHLNFQDKNFKMSKK